jgi:hypothetical protein
MSKESEASPDTLKVKVNFRIGGRMPSVYAHHMLVQPGENEVILSFYELILPPFAGQPSDEQLKAIEENGLVADCVARVTIAKNKFPGFAAAMQQIVDFLASEDKEAAQGITDADNSGNNPQD